MLPLNAEKYGKLDHGFTTARALRAHLDARDPNLAHHMRDAMIAFASTRMT